MQPKRRRWQFSLRDICLLMVIVALAISWWLDRGRLAAELASQREQQSRRLYVHWVDDLLPWSNQQPNPKQGFTILAAGLPSFTREPASGSLTAAIRDVAFPVRRISYFLADDSGPAAVEYALVLALILGAILGVVAAIARALGH